MQHSLKLNPELTSAHWGQIMDLFEKVNWSERDLADLKAAFAKSSFKVFVYDQDKVVAFGRTIDDGKYYAQVADIVVDPDYQGAGLGALVVNKLTELLKDYNFITLTSSTFKADKFYLKLGWKKQSTAFIWPLSEKQIRLHTEPGE